MTNSEFNWQRQAHATRNSAHVSANDAAAKTSEPTSAANRPSDQNRRTDEIGRSTKPLLPSNSRTNKLRAETDAVAIRAIA